MGLISSITDWITGGKTDSSAVSTFDPGVTASQDPRPDSAPVIGISGSAESSKSVIAAMTQIRSAGGIPVFLGGHAGRIHDTNELKQALINDLSHIDGLMVLGNDGDIDPAKYGAAKDPHTKVETDLARADYEEAAIRSAMEVGLPLLGVCGGMQRINVLGGGTLHQHVPDLVGDNHHMQGDSNIAGFVPVQVVKFTGGSMLSDIAGVTHSLYTPTHQAAYELPPGVVMENSFHHQAVKDIRPDFQVNAVSSDGIIEGIEPKLDGKYGKQFVLGVQWHPEFGASEVGPKIAKSFIGAAKDYAKTRPHTESLEPAPQNLYYDVHSNVPASPPPPQLMLLDPSIIKTDPATYQYRSGSDAKGVTEQRRISADRWDPILHGGDPLIVHQRANGEYYVVDGHHRLDLAQRTNAAGTGPGSVAAQVLREQDGYTAQDAKIIAAYKNLQHDMHKDNSPDMDLIDGARVFKEARVVTHPDWLPALQMNKGDLHVCENLSKLSDTSFDYVAKGKITARTGALIAEKLPDPMLQEQAVRIIGDRVSKEHYDISVQSNGRPVPQNASFPVTLPTEQNAAPAQPAPFMPQGHVERLMSQRAASAAMAR